MLTALRACSCHLPLSPQDLPLQPASKVASSLPAGTRVEGREGIPRWGQAVPRASAEDMNGWGGEGGPRPPTIITPFNCSLMGFPKEPASLCVFTRSHLVTFLATTSLPLCLAEFGGFISCKSICLCDCTTYFQNRGAPWKAFISDK